MINLNNYIEEKAERLLIDANCFSAPIDVRKCAEYLNVEIQDLDLDYDVSGFVIIKKDASTIGYNKANPPKRIRFTLAHELGHICLHSQDVPLFIDKIEKFNRDGNSSTGEILREREANAFAAALLMPEKLVRDQVETVNTAEGNNYIADLASKFEVSDQAMTIRLTNLGLLDYDAFAAE